MRRPEQVAVYVVSRAGGRPSYLMLRRPPSSGRSPYWQTVTGGAEDGEALEDSARRELREETGLVPAAVRATGRTRSFPFRASEWLAEFPPGTVEIRVHVFVAEVEGHPAPVLGPEHDDWRWMSLEEALERQGWEGDREDLREIAVLSGDGHGV